MKPALRVQVIGAGGWGIALARLLSLNGHAVRIWCREADTPDALRDTRESPVFLPGVLLPPEVEVVTEIDPGVDLAVFAVPSHAMRQVAGMHRFHPGTIRVSVAKGIENGTLLRMSEVIAEVAPGGPVLALSGPTHAEEVGRDLPASLVIAGMDAKACHRAQEAFFRSSFRVYTSEDIIGVELGGSLKNVIAIAAGVCDGFELGDNAKAALMTRGLSEMARLGTACGAEPLTFSGLSGMGDLIVTCASRHSRNRRLGEAIARGKTVEEALAASPMVAEGVRTTRSARAMAKRLGIEMPITEAVYQVLFADISPRNAIDSLLLREAKPERS